MINNGFMCFQNFDEGYHFLLKAIMESSNVDKDLGYHQVFTVAYKVMKPFVRRELIEKLGISYDWLNDELEERLSRKPINPGVAWKKRIDVYLPRLHEGKFSYTTAERIYDQLDHIVTLLKSAPDSRRAIICIWHPNQDLCTDWEVPSTISGQYFIRGNCLDALYYSRSSDCIKFLPADFFFYLGIQTWLASQLGVRVGSLAHIIGVLFVRDDDIKLAQDIYLSNPLS
jgi:thymidylate synthase